MTKTIHSLIAEAISPAIRKIHDIKVDILGKEVYYLRVTEGTQDGFGYREKTYLSGIINNVILEYPLSEIEMFDQSQNNSTEMDAISLSDILPITMTTSFEGSGVIMGVEEGDIIIDYLKDEHGNAMSIKLEVMRQIGAVNDRYLVSRKYELSLLRSPSEDDIDEKIDAYLATV